MVLCSVPASQQYLVVVGREHLQHFVSDRELLRDPLAVGGLAEAWRVGVTYHGEHHVLRGGAARHGRVVGGYTHLRDGIQQ